MFPTFLIGISIFNEYQRLFFTVYWHNTSISSDSISFVSNYWKLDLLGAVYFFTQISFLTVYLLTQYLSLTIFCNRLPSRMVLYHVLHILARPCISFDMCATHGCLTSHVTRGAVDGLLFIPIIIETLLMVRDPSLHDDSKHGKSIRNQLGGRVNSL